MEGNAEETERMIYFEFTGILRTRKILVRKTEDESQNGELKENIAIQTFQQRQL